MKLLGMISVNYNVTDQLLIRYSVFVGSLLTYLITHSMVHDIL